MYATLHRKIRKDMYVEDGSYDESIDIDLFALYEQLNHKYGDDGSYGFKDYNDLTDETKDQLVEIVSNFEVEGDTLYSVDEWIDRYGDHYGIEDCYEKIGELEGDEEDELVEYLFDNIKKNKVYSIFTDPLKFMVQSEVNELKTKRELRKVKANKLIEHIQLGLEKSLKKFDQEIESKLLSTLNES